MSILTNFIDRVRSSEIGGERTVVLRLQEARDLRDEMTRLLAKIEANSNDTGSSQTIEVQLQGDSF
jgi:hypothetical protein